MRQFYLFLYWVLLGAFISLPGCIEQEDLIVKKGNIPLTFTVSAKSFFDRSSNGVNISTFRFIAVEDGAIVLNELMDNGSSSTGEKQSYTFQLPSGSYKFCAIVNETSSMKAALETAKKYSELTSLKVEGNFTGANIPLYKETEAALRKNSQEPSKAQVSSDNGQSWASELSLTLPRTQAMVSLNLSKKTGTTDVITIKKVEICRIPDNCYMIPHTYTPEESKLKTVTAYNDNTGITLNTDIADETDEANFTPIFENNIIPEKYMTDKESTDETKAAYLNIYATFGGKNTLYTIKLKESATAVNYNLYRNTHYIIYATITKVGELANVTIKPTWIGTDVDGDIQAPYLNVSELTLPSTRVYRVDGGGYEMDKICYYFWSNQAKADIETSPTITDAAGKSSQIQDLFSVNLQFTKEEVMADGSHSTAGYIELVPKDDFKAELFSKETASYTFLLKAKQLVRTLNFSWDSKMNPTSFEEMPWVGIYYTKTQKGERIISSQNTGKWEATVEYPAAGADAFVLLTLTPTSDQKIWSESCEDAEQYEITSGHQSISAVGRIYFRVGLTSKTTDNRYARIKLETEKGFHYIYIRQGETADALMRVGDQGYNINADGSLGASITRSTSNISSFAVGGVNYNYGSPSGGSALTNQQSLYGYGTSTMSTAINTLYPTKGTLFFCWNVYNGSGTGSNSSNKYTTYGFHPNNPWGGAISPYPYTSKVTPSNTWNTAVYRDVCPSGYKHPTVDQLRYSLFQNVSVKAADDNYANITNPDAQNYNWGYYADGYFDRREIRSVESFTGTETIKTIPCVAGNGANMAYNGLLFYNPVSYASLFFPANGYRKSNDGTLCMPGLGGCIWTQSSTTAEKKQGLQFSLINGNLDCRMVTDIHPAQGSTVRCIKK